MIKISILIDKPKGITSYDVIRILRKRLGVKKMGHSGTLDPMATGLMIIGLGYGTKKLKDFIKLPKTYEAEVLLGISTTTGDMEGEVLEKKSLMSLNINEVEEVIKSLKGKLLLKVPSYSAVKVKGKRLYKLARAGKIVETPEREMIVLKIALNGCIKDQDHYVVKFTLRVTSGTYIRSIAEEIGRRLHIPATLRGLRRTSIGDYRLTDAMPV